MTNVGIGYETEVVRKFFSMWVAKMPPKPSRMLAIVTRLAKSLPVWRSAL